MLFAVNKLTYPSAGNSIQPHKHNNFCCELWYTKSPSVCVDFVDGIMYLVLTGASSAIQQYLLYIVWHLWSSIIGTNVGEPFVQPVFTKRRPFERKYSPQWAGSSWRSSWTGPATNTRGTREIGSEENTYTEMVQGKDSDTAPMAEDVRKVSNTSLKSPSSATPWWLEPRAPTMETGSTGPLEVVPLWRDKSLYRSLFSPNGGVALGVKCTLLSLI